MVNVLPSAGDSPPAVGGASLSDGSSVLPPGGREKVSNRTSTSSNPGVTWVTRKSMSPGGKVRGRLKIVSHQLYSSMYIRSIEEKGISRDGSSET